MGGLGECVLALVDEVEGSGHASESVMQVYCNIWRWSEVAGLDLLRDNCAVQAWILVL